MKILIVDDSRLMLSNIFNKLIIKGYSDIVTANDGITALEIIQDQKIDLIICDVMMPGISGLALMKIVNKLNNCSIPFILISSLNKLDIICKSLGFDLNDIMVKPINFNELFLKIEKHKKIQEAKLNSQNQIL